MKVRIAVAIDDQGNYSCAGWATDDCDSILVDSALENLHLQDNPDGIPEHVVIVEAEVPLPKRLVVEGTIEGTFTTVQE